MAQNKKGSQADKIADRQKAFTEAQKRKQLEAQKRKKEYEKRGEKPPNVFIRFGRFISRKFKEMRSELKKVTWPKLDVAVKSTLIVLAVVGCFLVALLLIDGGLSALLNLLRTAG